MKSLLILSSCLLIIGCQGNRTGKITTEQREKDAAFKDSIAIADGDKVLGNIRFGITYEEFRNEESIFMSENDYSLYGKEIQNIDGLFTNADELCRAIFVSVVEIEKSPKDHPFYPFVSQKFGLESSKNSWLIGSRSIILSFENRSKDMYYAMRESLRIRQSMKMRDYHEGAYNPIESFNYYVMYIQNDSLYTVYQQEQAESLKHKNEERARKFREVEDAEKALKEQQLHNL